MHFLAWVGVCSGMRYLHVMTEKNMFVFDLELQFRSRVACYTVLLDLSNASCKQTEYSVHSPIPIDDFLGSCFILQHLAQTEQ